MTTSTRIADGLRHVPFFAECDDSTLASFAVGFELRDFETGAVVMRRGDVARQFALLISGRVGVCVPDRPPIATLTEGSLFGELGLLTERPRLADVVAEAPCTALFGDIEAFDRLLRLPGVRASITQTVAERMAEQGVPVAAELADGTTVELRSLLPDDRAAFIAGLNHLSAESLRSRFFSGGRPPESVVEYLLSTNYIDHFAWTARKAGSDTGLAVARFIRSRTQPDSAEVAFGVADEWQGKGLATLLLGALAVAASLAGIRTLDAQVLEENTAMRAVFGKAGAVQGAVDYGIVDIAVDVSDALRLLDPQLARQLGGYARDIVTACGLALARSPHSNAPTAHASDASDEAYGSPR